MPNESKDSLQEPDAPRLLKAFSDLLDMGHVEAAKAMLDSWSTSCAIRTEIERLQEEKDKGEPTKTIVWLAEPQGKTAESSTPDPQGKATETAIKPPAKAIVVMDPDGNCSVLAFSARNLKSLIQACIAAERANYGPLVAKPAAEHICKDEDASLEDLEKFVKINCPTGRTGGGIVFIEKVNDSWCFPNPFI